MICFTKHQIAHVILALAALSCKNPVPIALPDTSSGTGDTVTQDAVPDANSDPDSLADVLAPDSDSLEPEVMEIPDSHDTYQVPETKDATNEETTDADALSLPPVDVNIAAEVSTVCLEPGVTPEPSVGSSCDNAGEVRCSNLGSFVKVLTGDFIKFQTSCIRNTSLRCEPVGQSGVLKWQIHWSIEFMGDATCSPAKFDPWWFTCAMENGTAKWGLTKYEPHLGYPCSDQEDGDWHCGDNGYEVCGDPKSLLPYPPPLDTNPCASAGYALRRWVGFQCSKYHVCVLPQSEPGKLTDYFKATCIQDTETKGHCAKSCEEMGLETAK